MIEDFLYFIWLYLVFLGLASWFNAFLSYILSFWGPLLLLLLLFFLRFLGFLLMKIPILWLFRLILGGLRIDCVWYTFCAQINLFRFMYIIITIFQLFKILLSFIIQVIALLELLNLNVINICLWFAQSFLNWII